MEDGNLNKLMIFLAFRMRKAEEGEIKTGVPVSWYLALLLLLFVLGILLPVIATTASYTYTNPKLFHI